MFTGVVSKQIRNAIESLESRRLLSATLVNGVLEVVGTFDADDISVSLNDSNSNQIDVSINGDVSTFNISAVNRIAMFGSTGDDHQFVSNEFGDFPFSVFMKGGAGEDLLEGSNLADILYGGGGDDLINGLLGNDFLYGEEGLDELLGSNGVDRLFGGDLNDLLEGGIGNDILKGGFGDDLLRGGDGLDMLFGRAGLDQLFGELGEDLLDGGLGEDDLDGGAGLDRLIGGLGNDDFVFNKLIELIDSAVEDIGDNINDLF